MDRIQAAEQLRRALQMFAATLSDEQAMEVAAVYSAWEAGREYAMDEILTYGTNSVGDPQLYRVVQAHTSAAEWTPDVAPSLYDAIGLDEQGYPVWSQPSGAHDAYNTGDKVARAAGKQLGSLGKMFGSFKDEFDKASKGE